MNPESNRYGGDFVDRTAVSATEALRGLIEKNRQDYSEFIELQKNELKRKYRDLFAHQGWDLPVAEFAPSDKQLDKLTEIVKKDIAVFYRELQEFLTKDDNIVEKVDGFEDIIVDSLTKYRGLSVRDFLVLEHTRQATNTRFVSDKLIERLEYSHNPLSEDFEVIFSCLLRTNDTELTYCAHRILDWLNEYLFTVYNKSSEQASIYDGTQFTDEIVSLLERELELSANYLVKKHIQDVLDTADYFNDTKEGCLVGVPGGSSDETIYTHGHIEESYRNRLHLGIESSFPAKEPVFEIAPGYFAKYIDGKPAAIYIDTAGDESNDADTTEREYVAQNNLADDYIYDELNEAIVLEGYMQHSSNKLMKLENIWDFKKHLKATGRTFYFDMARIDTEDLHPLVVTDLYTLNQQYRHALGFTTDRTIALTREEERRLIFPHTNGDVYAEYKYKFFAQLHMRKKIQDDFGVDIATLDFPVQRNFLAYLETQTVEEVDRLIEFTHQYGHDGLQAFLSLDLDANMAERILTIGEELDPEIAKEVYFKYGELVDAMHDIQSFVRHAFRDSATYSEVDISQVSARILRHGKMLLENFSMQAHTSNTAQILTQLESCRVDIVLLAETLRQLMTTGRSVELSDIVGMQVSSESAVAIDFDDREAMTDIYRANYAEKPDLQTDLLRGFNRTLADENTTIHTLKFEDELTAFFRLTRLDDERREFGAFNVNQNARGVGLGESFMSAALDREAQASILTASCSFREPISANYIERGFVATKAFDFNGEPSLSLVRNDRAQSIFKSKSLSPEVLLSSVKESSTNIDEHIIVQQIRQTEVTVDSFPISSSDNGYVLTRMIKDPKDRGVVYAVFEQVSSDNLRRYSEVFKSVESEV